MRSQKQILLIAGTSGLLAVALGAFGAHALKSMLAVNNRLDTYELAVRYHFYHTFALLVVGLLMAKYPLPAMKRSALFFLIGIVLFSGSLYSLCLLNVSKIAMITPIGGVFLMAGWASFLYAVLMSPE